MKIITKATKVVKADNGVETVTLEAANSNPGNPKNDKENTFSTGETPKATAEITVTNPAKFGFFVEDKQYSVSIEKA